MIGMIGTTTTYSMVWYQQRASCGWNVSFVLREGARDTHIFSHKICEGSDSLPSVLVITSYSAMASQIDKDYSGTIPIKTNAY